MDLSVGGTIVTPVRKRRKFPRKTLTWLAVSPFAAWAVARVAGLERGSLPTQFMTATPYIAAGSLVPLLVAAVSRNRTATAVAAIASTALAFSVLPRAMGSAEAAVGRPLKILTINMLFGMADARSIVALVRKYDPDVLSTQELTPGAVAELDAAGLRELMPHRVLQDEWSAGGSGLFAKYPLKPLWDMTPPVGHKMPAGRLTLPGGKPIEIIDVHPYPPLGAQVHDWKAALEAFPSASDEYVRVLAGDFNASLDHAALRELLSRGYKDAADAVGAGLIPTWPANKRIPPIITIDHVLVDQRASVRSVKVETVPGTDHRAVFAELTVPL